MERWALALWDLNLSMFIETLKLIMECTRFCEWCSAEYTMILSLSLSASLPFSKEDRMCKHIAILQGTVWCVILKIQSNFRREHKGGRTGFIL